MGFLWGARHSPHQLHRRKGKERQFADLVEEACHESRRRVERHDLPVIQNLLALRPPATERVLNFSLLLINNKT